MLEVPRELARVGVERDRGIRIERGVEERELAAEEVPGLCLRDAPVGEVEIRIVGPRHPRVAAGPEGHRQLAPRFAAGLALARDGVEAPGLLAGFDVVRTDVAAQTVETRASGESLQHVIADHDGAARIDTPGIGSGGRVPEDLAG